MVESMNCWVYVVRQVVRLTSSNGPDDVRWRTRLKTVGYSSKSSTQHAETGMHLVVLQTRGPALAAFMIIDLGFPRTSHPVPLVRRQPESASRVFNDQLASNLIIEKSLACGAWFFRQRSKCVAIDASKMPGREVWTWKGQGSLVA